MNWPPVLAGMKAASVVSVVSEGWVGAQARHMFPLVAQLALLASTIFQIWADLEPITSPV